MILDDLMPSQRSQNFSAIPVIFAAEQLSDGKPQEEE
jgi:hypothetical protein